jgi:para-aminobenzoate synthetase component 1
MIKYKKEIINRPSIEEIFYKTDKFQGISLFSASTENDKEITGFNPVIILTERELKKGNQSYPVDNPLKELDVLIRQNKDLPEEISLLGYISYDYKDRFEEKGLYERREQKIYPDFYFVLFEHYVVSSRSSEKSQLHSLNFPFDFFSVPYLSEDFKPVEFKKNTKSYYRGTSLNKKAYENAVKKTIEYIKNGDIYQANITRAIWGETELSPLESALLLYKSNRISYGVFASIPGGHVISTSPELFFNAKNGNIMASPIKGTIARSKDKEELLHSEKNIAELAMIVDLLRNDLSLVCKPGTVMVPRFPILMTLENVYHLYADVQGKLLEGISIGTILKKIFPGGSITGCPKIRSCQIIDELESTPRGIYTGSFGKISFNGNSSFNIMIRSLFQSGNSIIFNVGGGITLLSDPEEEYEETIHKGANIWKAIRMEKVEEELFCTGD